MPDYTEQQIETAARAARITWLPLHVESERLSIEWEHNHQGVRDAWVAVVRTVVDELTLHPGALDTPDPALHTWTPDDGPLADAIAGLPDGHPVTIRGDWGELRGEKRGEQGYEVVRCMMGGSPIAVSPKYGRGITSASWQRPAPAWATPRPPLVVRDSDGDLYLIKRDGTYRRVTASQYAPDIVWTADVIHEYGPITVLIDADGNHVGVDDE